MSHDCDRLAASRCPRAIAAMGAIEEEYKIYCFLLRLMSLWPFDNSLTAKAWRIFFTISPLTCIYVQISLIPANFTFRNILFALTFGLPLLLFSCRYVGIVYTFPTIRFIFEHLQSDFSTLRNPTELEILSKHAHSSRRVVYGFLCIACGSFAYVHLIIAGPLILDVLVPMNEPRDNGLQSFGFFVSTDNKNIYWVACIFLLSAMTGVITIICSESTLFVISQYCCGLFEIANYRFTNMIYETVHKPDNPRQRYFMRASMREAVEIHTKAINFVRIFGYDARLPYLIAIVVVVVSMSLNLYRSILAMTEKDDMKNMCNALIIGIIHVVAVFMGNYIGQEVIDNSVAIFHDIYNSLWYYCPVKMQKMVLLIMQRSISGSMLDFSGLFCPSNKGFATMMSSSFSYFTTICSLKGNV
ncbi:uncharacterized protein LOC117224175 isoform X3 [Megalopta genalis]|uniref:uncharacterized protein LOC117224175 isoform X3 n=1 Tax=Megalopta genalis TaxID=115081 RepID=UPI003FD65C29